MTKPIWLSRLSASVQLILGFVFGVALIAGGVASASYFYFRRMSTLPEKPVFYEETAAGQKELRQQEQQQQATKSKPATTSVEAAVEPKPEPESEPEPEPEPAPELPTNAYFARVTWPQGLSLRSEPSINAARVGGIAHNAEIIILEQSVDNDWQRVRLPWNQQEGWVKNGNTERVSN